MKKILSLILLLCLVFPTWGKAKYSFVKPDKHGKKVKIQINGKNRIYFRLDRKNPLELVLEGPITIKVVSRLDLTDLTTQKKVDYTIYCLRDSDKTHYTCSAVLAKGAKMVTASKNKIGSAEEFEVKIQTGKHKLKLFLDKKDQNQVYVRVLKKEGASVSPPERVAMHPQKFTRQVKILVKENEFDYYRIGPKDSLTLKVIGPASVKTVCRLEYNSTMNGDKKYRLQVNEDGKLKNTFVIATKVSEAAIYADKQASSKLSRGDNFYFEVPAGTHTYNFKLPDNGSSALLKFYLPTSALQNKP
jgi:hypothetical protein